MAWFWNQNPVGARSSYLPNSLEPSALSEWVRERRRNLPRSRIARTLLGIAFFAGGILSFLPILGIWMLPLGLVILSVDWPFIRRFRRQAEVNLVRWWKSRRTVGT
jgi:purine-cytosine permease-like protein